MEHNINNKREYILKMQDRTKRFAVDIIHFCNTLIP